MNDSSDPAPRSDLPSVETEGEGSIPTSGPFEAARYGICEIALQNPCGYAEAGARRIRPWLTDLVGQVAPDADELTVRFVSDREMRRLSAEYRQKDKTTDVLTFVGDHPPAEDRGFTPTDGSETFPDLPYDEGGGFLGDVVISVPTARRQAAERGHSVERELKILLLHGLLHCLGYDHEVDDGTMERKEADLRRRLGIEPTTGASAGPLEAAL